MIWFNETRHPLLDNGMVNSPQMHTNTRGTVMILLVNALFLCGPYRGYISRLPAESPSHKREFFRRTMTARIHLPQEA
jgi:hypothetical protein